MDANNVILLIAGFFLFVAYMEIKKYMQDDEGDDDGLY